MIEHVNSWSFRKGDWFTSVVLTGPTEFGSPAGYDGSDEYPLHTTWKLFFRPDDGNNHVTAWPAGDIVDPIASDRPCLIHELINPPWWD